MRHSALEVIRDKRAIIGISAQKVLICVKAAVRVLCFVRNRQKCKNVYPVLCRLVHHLVKACKWACAVRPDEIDSQSAEACLCQKLHIFRNIYRIAKHMCACAEPLIEHWRFHTFWKLHRRFCPALRFNLRGVHSEIESADRNFSFFCLARVCFYKYILRKNRLACRIFDSYLRIIID